MTPDRQVFRGLMFEANRIITAMESMERKQQTTGVALLLADAVTACQRLSELRGSGQMLAADARLVQTTLDLLETKLKSFGHPV